MSNITDNINTNIDYNYRALNRKDLMSLSTINDKDMPIRRFKQINTNRDWSTNLFNLDIEGSVPKKFGVFNHKESYINRNDDIERSQSKQLHIKLAKPEYYLSNRDIKGSSPRCVVFKTKRQPCNPLEPKYKLPKVEEVPVPVPKFIRDSIRIDDIEGAQPNKYFKWETRHKLGNDDIDGSSPRKPYERKTKYSNFNYSDVTHDVFKTRRCVNPLDPVYEIKYKNGDEYVYGEIEGSKPVTFNPYVYPDPKNLKTEDISGAQAGTKNKINKFTSNNYNLITKDIGGARSGSLKKGMQTKRETNPIDPRYNLPGNRELQNPENPYSKSRSVKPKTAEESAEHVKNETKAKLKEGNLFKSMTQDKQIKKLRASPKERNVPNKVLGFNNQLYDEDKVNFDPEIYKKPEPFHGFVRDKYVLSSEKNTFKPRLNQSTVQGKPRSTGDINESNTAYQQNSKFSSHYNLGQEQSSTKCDTHKQTYAQMLDKFVGETN